MISIAVHDVEGIRKDVMENPGSYTIGDFNVKECAVGDNKECRIFEKVKSISFRSSSNGKEYAVGSAMTVLMQQNRVQISESLAEMIRNLGKSQGFGEGFSHYRISYQPNKNSKEEKHCIFVYPHEKREDLYTIQAHYGRTIIIAGSDKTAPRGFRTEIYHSPETFEHKFSNLASLTEVVANSYNGLYSGKFSAEILVKPPEQRIKLAGKD